MIVVSETSVFIILSKLNCLDILPAIFGNVFIPPEVESELTNSKYDTVDILAGTTNCLHVQSPIDIVVFNGLNPGETAAIALAQELKADLLIIDEKSGRKVALKLRLQTVGTIGVLEMAAHAGLLDLPNTFEQIKQMKFHVTHAFLDSRLNAFELAKESKCKAEGEPPKDEQC